MSEGASSTNSSMELPVAEAKTLDLLISEDNSPVWPVNVQTRSSIEEMASVFGFRLKDVQAMPINEHKTCMSNVVALGDESAEHARLYAHLTGRNWVVANETADLNSPHSFEVLITQRPVLTSNFLDWLYESSMTQVPGIMFDEDPLCLTRQLLSRAAAVMMGGSENITRVDVLPTRNVDYKVDEDWRQLGLGSPKKVVIEAMSEGNSVLNVLTHSDGLDAEFGPNLVMCPVDEEWLESKSNRKPTCGFTGQCYRLKTSIDAPSRVANSLHPSSVATRAFVFNTCVGILPEDNNHDPRFGIGSRLVRNSKIGTLLTSWRPSVCTPVDTISLTKEIAEGVPVGRAVARHNDSHKFLGSGHQLCLIGDPRLQVVPSKTDKIGEDKSLVIAENDSQIMAISGRHQTSLLRACLTTKDKPREGSTPAFDPIQAKSIVEEIDAFEKDLDKGCDRHALGNRVRNNIVKLLGSRGRFCDLWIPKAFNNRLFEMRDRCRTCSNSTATFVFEFENPLLEPRKLTICPKCGFTHDSAPNVDLTLAVSDGFVTLSGDVPDVPWSGTLTVQYRWPLSTKVWDWPSDSNGRPTDNFELPEQLEPVPAWVTFTLAYGSRILLASQSLREMS